MNYLFLYHVNCVDGKQDFLLLSHSTPYLSNIMTSFTRMCQNVVYLETKYHYDDLAFRKRKEIIDGRRNP